MKVSSDLTGQRFGRLTVINKADDYVTSNGKRQQMYECKCDCGNIKVIRRSNLIAGTISCGCYRREKSLIRGMASVIDLSGLQFGHLSVIGDSGKRANNGVVLWDCKCDCGNHCYPTKQALIDRSQQSCGCIRISGVSNLIGHRYGKLFVLSRAPRPSHIRRGTYWNCRCDCGKNKLVERGNLVNGITTSCGCYCKQRVSESKLIDLTGRTFGFLTVINRAGDDIREPYWVCKCICGKQTVVRGSHLRTSDVVSCGCLSLSKGELFIDDILMIEGVQYKRQVKFDGLVGVGQRQLSYDFGLYFSDNLFALIEYQGEQHYKSVSYFGGDSQFDIQQQHDEIKRQYAINHSIPLLEIPYTIKQYDEISDSIHKFIARLGYCR